MEVPTGRTTFVARASRPLWRERLAPARTRPWIAQAKLADARKAIVQRSHGRGSAGRTGGRGPCRGITSDGAVVATVTVTPVRGVAARRDVGNGEGRAPGIAEGDGLRVAAGAHRFYRRSRGSGGEVDGRCGDADSGQADGLGGRTGVIGDCDGARSGPGAPWA